MGGLLPKAALQAKWGEHADDIQPQTLSWSRLGYVANADLKREAVMFTCSGPTVYRRGDSQSEEKREHS